MNSYYLFKTLSRSFQNTEVKTKQATTVNISLLMKHLKYFEKILDIKNAMEINL